MPRRSRRGHQLAQDARHVHGADRHRPVVTQRAHPDRESQQPLDLRVQLRLCDLAGGHRGRQPVAPRPVRAGHLQVHPGPHRRHHRPGRHPVGHDDPVEAPLVLEHAGEQPAVLQPRCREHPVVHPRVRPHDRPHACGDHRPERHEVHLAQRALVDPRHVPGPVRLGVVGGEVLHAHPHPTLLRRRDQRHRQRRGQQRVLGEALEVPTGHRGALEVHLGREHHVHPVPARLGGEHRPDPCRQAGVPGRGRRARRRERGRRLTTAPPHARRPVRHRHRPQPPAGAPLSSTTRPHPPPGPASQPGSGRPAFLPDPGTPHPRRRGDHVEGHCAGAFLPDVVASPPLEHYPY